MIRYLLAFLFGCYILSHALVCFASGPRTMKLDQNADCAFVAGWEIAYEPTALGNSLPSPAAAGLSVPNTTPTVCGVGTTFTIATVGVGSYRFWVQAFAADNSKSIFSNFVDAPLPFAAPVLKSVGP